MTPDLSDMVSANDIGQSSMFANYGDDSGDQCSLGKYHYTLTLQVIELCSWIEQLHAFSANLFEKENQLLLVRLVCLPSKILFPDYSKSY